MSKESIIVFDDGSIESKVLQHELKDTYNIKIINVESLEKLDKWIDKVIIGGLKSIVKIFLHFPYEDYVQKDIRTEIMEIERKNPNIRIIPWYEQAPRNGIKNRAANYGISESESHTAGISRNFTVEAPKEDKVIAVGKPFKLPEPVKPFSVEKKGGQVAITDRTVEAQGQSDPFKELADQFKSKRRRKQ